jgi:signal transduction histidine kinase
MEIPSIPGWPRYLFWARALLAAAALGFAVLRPPNQATLFQAVSGVFLVFSLVLALRGKGQGGLLGALALFADAAYFLVLAFFGAPFLLWFTAAFFLYVLASAVAFHGPAEMLVIAGICVAVCSVLPGPTLREIDPMVIVGGVVACACATMKRRQQSRAAALSELLEEAQHAAHKAGEAERMRIASDFHDGPLQSFISLQMRLEILRKLMERDIHAGMQDLQELQALAQSQVRDLRTFLHSMRPVDVDGANLIDSARRAAESFQKESGIPVTFMGTAQPVGLPPEMGSEVLQMVREALHNVQKHATATRVAVAMEKTDRGLEISVDDNGHGFNFAGTYSLEELELLRLGPASLKRRARSLNADLTVESRPGRGAGLKFRIPLQ